MSGIIDATLTSNLGFLHFYLYVLAYIIAHETLSLLNLRSFRGIAQLNFVSCVFALSSRVRFWYFRRARRNSRRKLPKFFLNSHGTFKRMRWLSQLCRDLLSTFLRLSDFRFSFQLLPRSISGSSSCYVRSRIHLIDRLWHYTSRNNHSCVDMRD
jgi:hypothetical protein